MKKFDVIKEIMLTRHSWRDYDAKKISDRDIADIIEAARHAPSAFGIEPWRLVIISNDAIKNQLYPLIWSQKQVLNASHLFLILTNKASAFVKDSPLLKSRYQTRYQNSDAVFNRLQDGLLNYLEKYITDIDEWAKRQSYILLENIILCAFAKGIGTSPMEGFDGKQIITYLETNGYIPKDTYNVAVTLAAGYLPQDKVLTRTSKSLTASELVISID